MKKIFLLFILVASIASAGFDTIKFTKGDFILINDRSYLNLGNIQVIEKNRKGYTIWFFGTASSKYYDISDRDFEKLKDKMGLETI